MFFARVYEYDSLLCISLIHRLIMKNRLLQRIIPRFIQMIPNSKIIPDLIFRLHESNQIPSMISVRYIGKMLFCQVKAY